MGGLRGDQFLFVKRMRRDLLRLQRFGRGRTRLRPRFAWVLPASIGWMSPYLNDC